MNWHLNRKISVEIVLAIAILVAVNILSIKKINHDEVMDASVIRSYEVEKKIKEILSLTQDIESGARGYVITGNANFLEQYHSALGRINRELDSLQKLIDNNDQLLRLEALRKSIDGKIKIAVSNVELRNQSGFNSASLEIASEKGKAAMDKVRNITDKMISGEFQILDERYKKEKINEREAIIFIITGNLIALLLLSIGMLIINNDVKKIKEVEQIAQDNEKRFKHYLDALPLGVYIANKSGNPVYLNKRAEVKTGKPVMPDTSIENITRAYCLYEAGTDHFYPTEKLPIRRAFKDGKGCYIDDIEIRNGNKIIPLEVRSEPIKNHHGEIEMMVNTFLDITERKKAEASLLSSQKQLVQFKRFFELSLDMVCIANAEGYFRIISPSFSKALGYSSQELLEKPFFEFIHPDDIPNSSAEFEKLKKGALIIGFVNRFKCKDGSYKYLNWVASPDISSGEYFGIAHDITEMKKTEEALKLAKERAEHSEKIKERFLANMSHEIRTPLNSIIGYTELLHKTRLSEKQRDYMDTIETASNNLLSLVDDILDVSKLQAGKMPIEKKPFSISAVLKFAHAMFFKGAEEKKLKFKLTIDKSIPDRVIGDPFKLMQVLTNLMSNAIKFTRKGDVHVGCEVLGKNETTAQVKFCIKDTGIGIEKDKLEKIFNRFEQGSSETSHEYGGTGLGLTIAKELVELHGGSLYVNSIPGKGSEFFFIINYPVSVDEPEEVIAGTLATERGFFNNVKILLVEDNEMTQKLVSTVLGNVGCEVCIAVNGRDAISQLKRKTFDLVLMDVKMPVMDGCEATKKIRGEMKSNIPVIATTAHAINGEREKYISSGMNDCITKPFREKELLAIISKHLKKATTTPETPQFSKGGSQVTQLDYLNEISKGSKQFVKEMIDTFLQQNPGEVSMLEKAIEDTDFPAIHEVSHKMQTSVSFVGLSPVIGDILLEMEELSEKKEGIEGIKTRFSSVKSVCASALLELKELDKS